MCNIQTPTRFLIDMYVTCAFSLQLTNTEAGIIQKKPQTNIKAKRRKEFVLVWLALFWWRKEYAGDRFETVNDPGFCDNCIPALAVMVTADVSCAHPTREESGPGLPESPKH